MHTPLYSLFRNAKEHRKAHQCGGVPYEQIDLLINTLSAIKATCVLEIGTGIGYSAACMASANPNLIIHTIDKDPQHIHLAKTNWQEIDVAKNIIVFEGKAHEVIKNFIKPYDLIFFDGYTPQRKFFSDFDRLLKKGGILVTANLFLNNTTGGKYLKELENKEKWQTNIIGDTALSVKLL